MCIRLWLVIAVTTGCAETSAPATKTPLTPVPFFAVHPPTTPIPPTECAKTTVAAETPGAIPDDVEVSFDGREFWMSDTVSSKVLRFGIADGAPLDPPMAEDVTLPWAQTQTPWGSLLVASIGRSAVYEVRPNSAEKRERLTGVERPLELAFIARDRLLLAETIDSVLGNGKLSEIAVSPDTWGARRVRLADVPGALDVATTVVDDNGTLTPANPDVYVVGGAMHDLWRLSPTDATTVVATGLPLPTDILYHPWTGGFLVSGENLVVWLDPDGGNRVTVVCPDAGVQRAEDLAIAPDGTVYLSDAEGARIWKIDLRY